MTPDDLLLSSAADLADGLRRREYSAVELCDAAIARIEQLDADIGAVVVRDFDRARLAAVAADAALASGSSEPLLGVPITVKESFDLTGHPTTWGFEELRGHRATADAVAVRRLKEAGAVVLGKTNVPAALNDWQSVNPIHGLTRNPYDLARTPGGSSGGAAAAVAMGFSALELGSDIGGSIRVPAAFCGVFGHKPTWGIVPSTGQAPGGAVGAAAHLAVVGPLARTAGDLALALDVIAGPGDLDPANRLELPAPRHSAMGDYRVLVLDTHPSAQTDSAVQDAVASVAVELAAAGAAVVRTSPLLPDLGGAMSVYREMLDAVSSRGRPDDGSGISAHRWFALLDEQVRIRLRWQALFADIDVVIAPAFGTVAFPHIDEPDHEKRTLEIDGRSEPYEAQLAWPSIATLADLPATAAPVGMTHGGLPLGVQVIGPHREDRTTIAVAGMIAGRIAPPGRARRADLRGKPGATTGWA